LEELLSGDKIWDLVSGVSREMLQSRLEARNRGESVPSQFEAELSNRKGSTMWVDCTANPIE